MTEPSNPVDFYKGIVFSIGAKLARDAVWHKDMCTWIGYTAEKNEGKFQVIKSCIQSDIANGNAGVLQFLNRINKAVNDPIIGKTLLGTRRFIKETLYKSYDNIGYYNGNFGKAISLLRTIEYEDDFNDEMEFCQNLLRDRFDFDPNKSSLNVIEGLMGIVEVLLNNPIYIDEFVHTQLKTIHQLLISSLGDTKLMNLQKTGYGYSIHGTLTEALRLAIYLDDSDGQQKIADTIKLTSSFHGPLIDTWRKSKNINEIINHKDMGPYSFGWLNGIAGNSKAILTQYKLLQIPELQQLANETADLLLEVANYAMTNRNWFANFSINHGLSGIGQSLLLASSILENPKYQQEALRIGEYGYENIFRNAFDWPSGVYAPDVFGSKPTYGLQNGIAGTGMYYMDLIELQEP